MATTHLQLAIILYLLHLSITSAKWFYTFEIDVSWSTLNWYGDGSTDVFYWRLCSDSNCGVWIKQSSGWPSAGVTYTHSYPTPAYMGDINIVYIIDTGDDKLGVDQVRVYNSNDTTSSSDVTTWDYGVWTSEYNGGYAAGCVENILSSGNTWNQNYYDDCIWNGQYDDTYSPSPQPTSPTEAPTRQTTFPTYFPTNNPTSDPTHDPTKDPTTDPTIDPTIDPTSDPTAEPTRDPTSEPTTDPTNEPTAPTTDPTTDPTFEPTLEPTLNPSLYPTLDPTFPTNAPTFSPTSTPTNAPTASPLTEGAVPAPTTEPTTSEPTIDYSDFIKANEADNAVTTSIMVGAVFGGLFLITLCILIAYCFHHRNRRMEQNEKVKNVEMGHTQGFTSMPVMMQSVSPISPNGRDGERYTIDQKHIAHV